MQDWNSRHNVQLSCDVSWSPVVFSRMWCDVSVEILTGQLMNASTHRLPWRRLVRCRWVNCSKLLCAQNIVGICFEVNQSSTVCYNKKIHITHHFFRKRNNSFLQHLQVEQSARCLICELAVSDVTYPLVVNSSATQLTELTVIYQLQAF